MAKQNKISVEARNELIGAVARRYREGGRTEKLRILDEFVALTGYHRKHAIRVLNGDAAAGKTLRFVRARIYDEAVRQALVVLWEASDRICGKRLKPLLPVLLPALEQHGHMQLAESVRARLLSASAATIDRVLAPTRASIHGRRNRRRATPAVQRSVPVRTFADWNEPLPGFMEADLVAHCGDALVGSFVHTLTLTDIASGWTECVVLVVREAALVVHSVETLRTRMPFPLRGLDTDNGSEFMNETLFAYCVEQRIEFTRSRPYHKNDQAWVEQKNGAIVRRLIGYRRLEGMAAAETLSRLYAASRLFVNFFQPSFKLAEKTRVGARVRKRYHAPATPAARLLASDAVPDSIKEQLRAVAAKLDPLQLLGEIRTLQQHLVELADGNAAHVLPHRGADLERFLKGLATAWQDGEVRPTHQIAPKPRRNWRTRVDPFEAVWPGVRAWLDTEPDRTAKELFQRLQGAHAGVFPDGQLRTLQRRVSEWRRAAARKLVFAIDDADSPEITALDGGISSSAPPHG